MTQAPFDIPRMFQRVLIANRGAIAARIARTCKRMELTSIAVFSDADAGEVHVEACDLSQRIGPAPVRESYLNVEAILEAARATGAEAVHPGYGLLSENPEFAEAVESAGLVFVGPKPATLRLFGDKVQARKAAELAGLPITPGTEPLESVAHAKRDARALGYPVVVKAVAGGGGIGMSVATDDASLERVFEAAGNRALSAFADGRVYLEKHFVAPRHIEVQLLADAHGHAVGLGERECSIQRRYQKIIEESPSPYLAQHPDGEAIRQSLCESSAQLFLSTGYLGAGTCEYLLDRDGRFYFLEVNARLQVEHGVTEMRTGLDLVEWQLRIAAGEELTSDVLLPRFSGHSIEARIYAENPQKGFMPAPGDVTGLRWPNVSSSRARIEAGIQAGSKVTPYYDPLVAKIITFDATRHGAYLELDRILAQTTLDGLTTNMAFIRQVLAHKSFRAGQYDTDFVARLVQEKR